MKKKIVIIFLVILLSGFLFVNNSKADEACTGSPDGTECYLGGKSGTCKSDACDTSDAAATPAKTNSTAAGAGATATATGTGLIPCGTASNPCTICYMVLTIQNIINFGLKIFVYVGILMVVIAGITYIISAGSSTMMETAKGFLKNALIGFGIMLGAWLIVNTTMIVIGAHTNLGIAKAGNWYTFKCVQKSQLNTSSGTTGNVPTTKSDSQVQGGGGSFNGTGATGSW